MANDNETRTVPAKEGLGLPHPRLNKKNELIRSSGEQQLGRNKILRKDGFSHTLGLGSPVSRQVLQVDHGLLAHPDESGAWPVEIDD